MGGGRIAQVKGMFWLKLIGLIMYFACLAVSSSFAKEPAIYEYKGLMLVSVYLTFSLCHGWALHCDNSHVPDTHSSRENKWLRKNEQGEGERDRKSAYQREVEWSLEAAAMVPDIAVTKWIVSKVTDN